MKLLFFTDTHIRGTTPRNRKDNFYETLKMKFKEIKELADEFSADYILHGGDWFDRPDISPSIVREFAQIINTFKRPIYSVAGNHDLFGHNPETLKRTMLGILEGIGLINVIDSKDIVLEKKGIKVQLSGSSYYYDIDGEDYKKYYIVDKRKDVDYSIHMMHGMLLTKPFLEGIQYTLIDDIKDTHADITLSGHYHSGFGIKKINSKYFINPGSLVRVANTLAEIERHPKVVLIDLKESISIKEIELKTALPGDEILDREKLERSQDRNIKLYQFYKGIESSGEYKKIDLGEIIEQIASNQDLSKAVKDEAVRRIAIARENFGTGDGE